MAQVDALNDQLTQSQNQLKILKANIVMKTRLLDDVKNQCGQIENDLEDIRQSRYLIMSSVKLRQQPKTLKYLVYFQKC